MITGIAIENFRAFGARQQIDFRPITLLYGPNSAGKSTIINALRYVRDLLRQSQNAAPNASALDSDQFANYVYRHDLTRTICLRISGKSEGLNSIIRNVPDDYFSALAYDLTSLDDGAIELCVSRSSKRAFVSRLAVIACGEPLVTIQATGDDLDTPELFVNLQHDLLTHVEIGCESADRNPERAMVQREALQELARRYNLDAVPEQRRGGIPLNGQKGVIPSVRDSLPLEYPTLKVGETIALEQRQEAMNFIDCLVRDPVNWFLQELDDWCDIGPIRHKPAREHQPPSKPESTRWYGGLAAWDRLAESFGRDMLDHVNDWLGEDHLSVGYSIHLPSASELLQRPSAPGFSLQDKWGTLLAAEDVGEGITQVVPIVVALLYEREALVSIEQPELHIHPRLQAALGDVFLERIRNRRGEVGDLESSSSRSDAAMLCTACLVETHSEHLLLRLLRRIRQQHEQRVSELQEHPLPAPWDARNPSHVQTHFPDHLVPDDDLVVLYVQPGPDGAQVLRLRVDEEGEFIDDWPHGFFDERGKELFE